MKATLYEYQIQYTKLTKKLYEEKRDVYDIAMIVFQIDELNKGAYMRKMNKPNSKGTAVTYRMCKTPEELIQKINLLEQDAAKIGITIERSDKYGLEARSTEAGSNSR